MKLKGNEFTYTIIDPLNAFVGFHTKDIDKLEKMALEGKEGDYTVEIKKPSKTRSIGANAYHYLLCEKIAKTIHSTAEEVHARLMVDYGTPWLDEEEKARYWLIKDSPRSEPGIYLRPTDGVEYKKGIPYRWHILIKPSHLYDSKEMADLIDGTIQEAQAIGIDTITPEEKARMIALYGEHLK